MLQAYVKKLVEITNRGDAREESFYSTLENLLYSYTASINKKVHVTTLPAQTEAGNPDFRVWDGKTSIVGYIEAKSPTIDDLNTIENSEQLTRYRHTFPNLILTNFLEYRLYRDGSLVDKVLLGRPFVLNQMQTAPPIENADAFLNLLQKFFAFSFPKVYHAKTLAVELAKRTRFLRDEVIAQELNEEEKAGDGSILSFYETFKKFLIGNLSLEDFADLYSQTITYGLFAARTRSKNGFNRKLAYDNIPHTIGILREVFSFVSLGKLPEQMEWIIDDIAEVLAVTDVKSILHKYFHQGKGKDPIVHFYETFLAEYDSKTRERRGVYYTPEPVVSYIVRSINILLKEHFAKNDGLASDSVTVLDPAAGTLTFLAEAAKLAEKEFISKYGAGGKSDFIKEHILKNFFAFELMMAPYAIGHIKMSFLLEELGYRLHEDDRFKLYLTNTLEMEELSETQLPGMKSLSEESHLAGRVKKEIPILVIMGNPPYSGHSSNIGDWITKTIKTYYQVDGQPLGEKNPKWLQDDYVKFIRFAQWKLDQAGEGVLGFITNHSFLDNPTFRGMRQSLMQSFDELYVLDLHGNSLKKEKAPDDSKDENVFDIQQGVAISLFVKKRGQSEGECKVYHSEVWGLRENKYKWLSKNNVNSTKWAELIPKSEFYLFVPRNEDLFGEYRKFSKITDIFSINSVGVVTARDSFVIDFDKETLKRRIAWFRDKNTSDDMIRDNYGLQNKTNWELAKARNKVTQDEKWQASFERILYRPFDSRWIFYSDALVERSRKEVMRHMFQENLGLLTCRQQNQTGFQHVHICNNITEACAVSNKTREINYLFPLYLSPDKEKQDLFSFAEGGEKQSNISPVLIDRLDKAYKNKGDIPSAKGCPQKGLSSEQIFYYIYAVLYSNAYRTKFAEFLKIDFPRIPFTKDCKLFTKMAEYGKRLVDLHLLKSNVLNSPIAKFQGKGDNKVEKPSYQEQEQRVYFNESQYFEGTTKEVYKYQIGGYQVCEKWLKDRKGRQLSLDDIKHYCKIVTALAETIKVQQEIDPLYPQIEENLIEIFEQSEVSLQS